MRSIFCLFSAMLASAVSLRVPVLPLPSTSSIRSSSSSSSSSCLPLLPPGTLFGAQYATPSNETLANLTNPLYGVLLQEANAKLMQISLPWADLEPVPGQPNYPLIAELLSDAKRMGLIPLFQIAVIDTNRVSVPPDLVDPSDFTRLRPGLNWTSPEIIDRYAELVTVAAPLAAYYGAIYFGVGNEVSVNLNMHPETVETFAGFVFTFKQYIQQITSPDLSVGVTFTVGDLANTVPGGGNPNPPWLPLLTSIADVTPLTYYPLQANFSVITDMQSITETFSNALSVLPADACIIMQELGIPSGYDNASSVDGSTEKIQASFFTDFINLLRKVNSTTARKVRAVSAFQFVDMTPEECEGLIPYYNATGNDTGFIEYLCTLGIVNGESGKAKAAYTAYLNAIRPPSSSGEEGGGWGGGGVFLGG